MTFKQLLTAIARNAAAGALAAIEVYLRENAAAYGTAEMAWGE